MPVLLQATPAVVVITEWSYSKTGSTQISWDTGLNTRRGTVKVSDSKSTWIMEDSLTNAQAKGRASGTCLVPIRLGETYTFKLTRDDNSALLATLVLTGVEQFGLPTGLLTEIDRRTPYTQAINRLRIIPDVESVFVGFVTRQATSSTVTVEDGVHGVGLQSSYGRSTSHGYSFQLGQDTVYTVSISAPAADGSLVKHVAQFRTGRRSATVFFDNVYVNTDGDPGWLGAGEFRFYLSAGNRYSRELVDTVTLKDDISGGDTRAINQSVFINYAESSIWVQAFAYEDDSIWEYFLGPMTFAPEGAVWEHRDDGFKHGEQVTVTRYLDLTRATPDVQEIPFTLDTGPMHIIFSVRCRLQMQVEPGVVLWQMMTRSVKPHARPSAIATIVADGRRALTSGQTHFVQRTPDGSVFHTRAGVNGTRDRNWTQIASDVTTPLTAFAARNGQMHLLTTRADGEVFHRATQTDGQATDAGWKSLGRAFVGQPSIVETKAGIELFALNPDGAVFHRSLATDSEWVRIGEGMTGSLNAFTTARGDVGVVALDRQRTVRHLDWSREAGPGTWHSLGEAPEGSLFVEAIDEVIVFASIGDDEVIHAAPLHPDHKRGAMLEWRKVGTIDSLINSRFSLIPPQEVTASDEAVG